MGRGKLSMQLIPNEKSRKTTFLKRKKSLMRKAYELSMLCDVRMCVLIYGPKLSDEFSGEVHTWPPCRSAVEDMIKAYKTSPLHKRSRKVFNLYDFFAERKKKLESEITKLRKDMAEIKYPKWNDNLEFLSEDQLRFLVNDLDSKIDAAKRKIDFIAESSTSRALTSNFKQELSNVEEQISVPGIENQFPFHLTGNSIQMMPMTPMMPNEHHGVDFSQFLLPSIPYNNGGHFQSSVYSDPIENNAAMELSNLNYAICHYAAAPVQSVPPLSYMQQFADPTSFPSSSQVMLGEASGFGSVNDNPFDYLNYEYLMKMNNF